MLINKEKITYLIANKPNTFYKILIDDIYIKPSSVTTISLTLQHLQYFLITMTAIDQLQKSNRFLLNYVFTSYLLAQRIYITWNSSMTVPSITNIFPSAIWLEREIYDLFGIFFESNSKSNDLRRILTDYHFKGHPLRKDFSLIGYSEKYYSNMRKSIQNKIDFSF